MSGHLTNLRQKKLSLTQLNLNSTSLSNTRGDLERKTTRCCVVASLCSRLQLYNYLCI